MGCDIHLYNEMCIDGHWMSIDPIWTEETDEYVPDVPYNHRFTARYYPLFGVLAAGVRGYKYPFSIEIRGMPTDASEPVKKIYEEWGDDAHSASYITLDELKGLIVKIMLFEDTEDPYILEYLKQLAKRFDNFPKENDYRIVFFFDN